MWLPLSVIEPTGHRRISDGGRGTRKQLLKFIKPKEVIRVSSFLRGVLVGVTGTTVIALVSLHLVSVQPLTSTGTPPAAASQDEAGRPFVQAQSPEEAGKYLVQIGGCHDCHTPGWKKKGYGVPKSRWLTGVPVGYSGPWGTTYAPNLRTFFHTTSMEEWIQIARNRTKHPPMPWVNLRTMNEKDLRAMYRFTASLEPSDKTVPDRVPPGEPPPTPFYVFQPLSPVQYPKFLEVKPTPKRKE